MKFDHLAILLIFIDIYLQGHLKVKKIAIVTKIDNLSCILSPHFVLCGPVFESQRLYVFVHFSQTFFFFFFFRNQEILCFFMRLDPGDHFTKSRPASCGQNLHVEKFHFQIISKPFDRYTSYLVWWCKKIIDISWYIFRWPWLKVKGQISRTNRKLNLGSYLTTYLTQRLHTWYQDTS